MKVAFVIGSLRFSGAERVLISIANEMTKKGTQIYILLLNGILTGREETYTDGLDPRIICIDAGLASNNNFSKIQRMLNIRKVINKVHPDVVVSFGVECNCILLPALFGCRFPVVVSERNDPKIYPFKKTLRIRRKILYCSAKGYVFQTEEAKAFFSTSIQSQAAVIPNPVAAENIPTPYSGERRKDIVSVGRLDDKQKNYKLLFRAFALLASDYPEYRVVIYGEGPDRPELEAEITKLNLTNRIFMPGAEADVPHRIRDAAMFVLSSNFEGMPNALIEAMAVGMPVVSTDCPCGGPKFLIKHGENGLLAPVDDIQRLALAMRDILENPVAAEKMAHEARKILQQLAPEKITLMWEQYIEGFVER